MSDLSTSARLPTAGMRARRHARYLSGLLWHTGAFVIVNASFWALDLGLGPPGAHWAFWITGVWGFALAFHLLAYAVNGREVEERSYRRYLARARRREPRGADPRRLT